MGRVRFNFKRALFVPILLIATIIGIHQPVSAQSSVDLVLHYVEGKPIQGQFVYDVSVYFSLLDSAGNPIKDAQLGDFAVNEDGQGVKVVSLASAEKEPIDVALVLDTSGSMVGAKMTAARAAASDFINSLQSEDQVAVLTFDTTITPRIDFTTDHTAASQQVTLINAAAGTGTCLYDAAYQAVQKTAVLPTGRRAIILMTDGVDEVGGKPCSTYTLDDVIDLASQGTTRVPIYTIGLGSNVDQKSLERLSNLTGGRYLYSPEASQLDALFLRLSDQLRSQYVLHYTSSAAPGAHTLIVKATYRNAQGQDSRNFVLPALPYSLTITSPSSGQELTGKVKITVTISGQGNPIQQILFLANGVSIGSVKTAPYELEWDPTSLGSGQAKLEAVAQDASGAELAHGSVTVTILLPANTPTPAPMSTPAPAPSRMTIILGVVIAVIVIGVVAAVLMIASKRRSKDKERDKRWQQTVQGVGGAEPSVSMDDRTVDVFTPSEAALGVLVVLQSDDPAMEHQRIEITKSATNLGRKADNDVIFAKDSPVSRHHAVIEERSGQLFLSEVIAADESGRAKRPAYGTFVNERQIEDPVPLHDGDEIRLGKRVRLRFEAVQRTSIDGERTIDQIAPGDDEKTADGL